MDGFILLLELTGPLAFAASGAMTGLRKHMDVFGVCILGLTTAVGGGYAAGDRYGSADPVPLRQVPVESAPGA